MSSGNNTMIPLIAGGVFTGTWEKRVDLAVLSVNFYTNKDSSLVVEQSSNGTTATNAQTFNYTAGLAKIFQQYLVLEYFRIIVTNTSAQSQAYLRVSSRLSNVVAPFSGDFSGAVSVTNFPETQAVSIAVPVPVTGDFYQATQPISGSVSVSNLQDISGVTVLVSNFPETQAVTVSGCPPVQMLGSLTTTNAVYNDTEVEAIITFISVTDGFLSITFDGPTAFTNGQSVILTQIDALPKLNGRVYQISYQVGSGATLVISTPDLDNIGTTASTGVAQSVRVNPLVCNDLGRLLVDISGQDVLVNNLQDISGITVVTDISGQSVLVGNFPATQPVSGSVNLLAAADPTTCVGTVRITDVYGQGLVTTAGNLMVGINNIYTNNPIHTIVDSGSVNIANSVAVTGDFYQATQPVSGSVSIGNFPAEQVVDVSGVVVTSSQHLNNLNATYAAGAVVGNITLVNGGPGNTGKVIIETSDSIVLSVGQQVVIAGATTFPQLNGVRTIAEVVNSTFRLIYFSDFVGTNDDDVGETGTISSYGSSPLLADVSGNLLVKVEGIAGDVSTVVKATTLAYSSIALSNTGQVVSAVAATIRQFSAQNTNATAQYIKIYNKATAATSADSPVFTYFLPSGVGVSYELNHLFSLGISVRATFLPAVADNTAAADYVFTNLTYST